MKLLIHLQTSTCNRWILGMDKWIRPTLYRACDYWSMLGLKLVHVSEGAKLLNPGSYRGVKRVADGLEPMVASTGWYRGIETSPNERLSLKDDHIQHDGVNVEHICKTDLELTKMPQSSPMSLKISIVSNLYRIIAGPHCPPFYSRPLAWRHTSVMMYQITATRMFIEGLWSFANIKENLKTTHYCPLRGKHCQ